MNFLKVILRALVRATQTVPRMAMVLFLLASLALNLATLTVTGVYTAASAALSAVGVSTVAAREVGEKLARRKAIHKLGRDTAEHVTRRVRRGAVRNISSVAGEAIPVVGVAVIAGALALEVKDSCDTAADMAGLQAALEADVDPDSSRKAAIEAFDCKAMIREELPDFDDLPSGDEIWTSVKSAPGGAWQAAKDAGISLADRDWSGSIKRAARASGAEMKSWFDWSSSPEEESP